MSLFIRQFYIGVLLCGCIFLFQCRGSGKKKEYTRTADGSYYKLISFGRDTFSYRPHYTAHLSAGFYTQADSLFWDSHNNLADRFFMEIDSAAKDDLLKKQVSRSMPGDSFCMLVRTSDFFLQQFRLAEVPFFSKSDSVVKLRIKVKEIIGPETFGAMRQTALQDKEQEQVDAFIKQCGEEVMKDPLGFYWIGKVALREKGSELKPGALLTLVYKGTFLNGRFLEASPEKFEMAYGTSDQLLKGLNYVIGRIKLGQNVKIILPSRLAFGENGSTNGIVPPYTPLLYDIKITDIKQ